jgi:hypothetical protein
MIVQSIVFFSFYFLFLPKIYLLLAADLADGALFAALLEDFDEVPPDAFFAVELPEDVFPVLLLEAFFPAPPEAFFAAFAAWPAFVSPLFWPFPLPVIFDGVDLGLPDRLEAFAG